MHTNKFTRTLQLTLLALWLGAASFLASADAPNGKKQAPSGAPWRSLPLITDGKIDPAWAQVGWGGFVVDDGALRTACDERGMGLLFYKAEKFGDCQIRIVYRCEKPKANSGVFIRIDDGVTQKIGEKSSPARRDAQGKLSKVEIEKFKEASAKHLGGWYPVHHGYEVQINDAGDPQHRTGALYSLTTAAPVPSQPQSAWRTMIITLESERVTVAVDGKRLSAFDASAANIPPRKQWTEPIREITRPTHGYIGLQNHDPGDVVWFKEVSVRPLGPAIGGPVNAYDAPADPNASASVKRVLKYLGEVADSDKVLSGQFRYDEGNGGDCVAIHKATGQWPAVLEHYFYVASAKPQAKADEQNDRENAARRQKMLDYWKSGGLVSIWAKLLVRHSGVRQAPGDWADVWKPGTPKNNTLKEHFDRFYIPHMKWLQERGVVLIFRAYNEECEYFKDIGDENMKRLWVWTFNYFTKTHGLHNLIWFYAGNRGVGEQYFTRYPGDQYVDMVGFSDYTIKKPEPKMVDSYNMIRKRLPGKIFALAEEGWDDQATGAHDSREVIDMIRTRMPRTAFWLSWSQHWSPALQLHGVELYKDPWVINRDQVNSRPR